MPDNTDIERVIFKLDLDGSAYVEGADKLTASTNKLSQAQEAANKKLKELEAQQASYKKQLDDTTTILKENEKETLDLTKRLNELKNAGKGATAEAKALQAQLRGLATNTKEFKIEAATLKKNLTDTTSAIKVQSKELAAAEKAGSKFSAGMSKVYSSLSKVANIIPGLGIGGLVALIAGPLVEAVTNWVISLNDANDSLKLLKANQENLNEIMEAANKSAGKQITDLKILYQTATDVNVSMNDRLAAVKALQQEFPDYFANVEAETILNGKAEEQYKALAISIINTARATAAKAKIDELEAKVLDEQYKRNNLLIDQGKKIIATQKATFQTSASGGTGGGSFTSQESLRAGQLAAINKQTKAGLAEIDQNIKFLQQQEDFLVQFVGRDNLAKVIEDKNNKKTKEETKKGKGKSTNPVTKQNDEIEEENERLKRLLAYNLEVFRNWQKNIEADSRAKSERDKREQAERDKELDDYTNAEFARIQALIKAKNDAFEQDSKNNKKKRDEISSYATQIGNLAASVVQFWQLENEAEAKALDKSIELQEKRVDAAIRIAERGNAEYLKAEEDRLTELNVARENAARKQLAIDAALQASQILVGITGAIAKIATPGIGTVEVIAAIATIVGALATGYGLVRDLQGNQPKLYEGTKYLDRDGHPKGRDTIPAYLNEGEAVIPTDKNKKYHPAVSAIYDGTIPAEDMNNFVRNYHKLKPIPQPNYDRIKEVAELKIGQDGRMSVLLSEQNKKIDEHINLQRQMLRAMNKMSVSATIDRNGVAIMVNEYIEQIARDKNL